LFLVAASAFGDGITAETRNASTRIYACRRHFEALMLDGDMTRRTRGADAALPALPNTATADGDFQGYATCSSPLEPPGHRDFTSSTSSG
jgi:hypothetical protein